VRTVRVALVKMISTQRHRTAKAKAILKWQKHTLSEMDGATEGILAVLPLLVLLDMVESSRWVVEDAAVFT